MRGSVLMIGLVVAIAACALPASGAATMTAYADEAELRQALSAWREKAKREARTSRAAPSGALMMEAAPATAAAPQKAAADSGGDSITNVQTAGVDEGGIVKRAGEHLVILRRGRLFTVRVGADALAPAAVVDAYAPGADPQGAWYDELLVSGRTVVVVGYSYARGGTEIGLFDLDRDGALAHRATYHLRSFDYYSSRNYASRLVGNRLVFYTPMLLHPFGPEPWTVMPGFRRWQRSTPPDFERILPATRVYRTDDDFDPAESLALHTVTSCDLSAAAMQCESTAVLGPAGRVFYVSQGSVYVWTSSWRRGGGDRPASAVFRLPLDGTAPSALKAAGVPVDQMSFLEDSSGHLNVLLRADGRGEGMSGSESGTGPMALMRVPLAVFGDGRDAAQPEHYRRLPGPGRAVQNRYVGDWLLWGGHGARAWALRYAGRDEPAALDPGHDVERIEAMGRDALLVGNSGADLHFTSARLDGPGARLAGRHIQPGARQGERRTHGFFFHATGDDGGVLGLPVLGPAAQPRHGVHAQVQGSASVVFLRQRDLDFSALGELRAQPGSARDDACKASCVDWYGNARPIFLGDRVFALMGYELVEGRLLRGPWHDRSERLEERRRIVFAPSASRRGSVYSPFD